MSGGVTEDELRRSYPPADGVPVNVHAELQLLAGQVDQLQIQTARAVELLETLLGIAVGEIVVATGLKVEQLTPENLARALAPCPACGWIASHDEDCPATTSAPGAGL